jgi:hypothetical protein
MTATSIVFKIRHIYTFLKDISLHEYFAIARTNQFWGLILCNAANHYFKLSVTEKVHSFSIQADSIQAELLEML